MGNDVLSTAFKLIPEIRGRDLRSDGAFPRSVTPLSSVLSREVSLAHSCHISIDTVSAYVASSGNRSPAAPGLTCCRCWSKDKLRAAVVRGRWRYS